MSAKVIGSVVSDVIILGEYWPEVEGIRHFYNVNNDESWVNVYYSIENINEVIDKEPHRKIILLIQPHNYAYFLYKLSQRYSNISIKIIASELYFSDLIILDELGFKDFTTFEETIKSKKTYSMSPRKKIPLKLDGMNEISFLKFINNKIITQLCNQGLTFRQQCVLSLAVKGMSNERIANILKISSKTVSAHKIDALNKLPYGNHRYALTKGLQAQYPRISL